MRLAFFLVFSVPVFAQTISVGIEGGVPLTHVFDATIFGSDNTTQRPYIVGPAIQIHLWRPLYLDAEGSYSRPDYSVKSGVFVKHAVDRWEIPILLKAKFNSQHFVRPFVAAGVSLLHGSDSAIPPS